MWIPPLQHAATCFRMKRWLRDFGHASSLMEFFIPMCVRPHIATPADLPSASVTTHSPIAVLQPEFLAACSASLVSNFVIVDSCTATKSACVFPNTSWHLATHWGCTCRRPKGLHPCGPCSSWRWTRHQPTISPQDHRLSLLWPPVSASQEPVWSWAQRHCPL